ncbi:TyeA family type III secretion system gatekeeper subunit, partial [Acinetobacter baumannii]
LTDIVAITDSRWVDAHTIEGLAAKRAVDRLPDQIDFLKSVRAIFRQFPVHSYPDKETRNAVLDANQAALDIIIAKEDEE